MKPDLWMASPSKLYLRVNHSDICCEACAGSNPNDQYNIVCWFCKWRKNPVTVDEIIKMREKEAEKYATRYNRGTKRNCK